MEIDILGVDDTELVLVELLPRLSQDDVDEFIEKLTRFKIAFPHYKNYRAYGAVAGIEINEGIDRYAYKKGFFGFCYAMDGGYKGWNPYIERHLAIFVNYFCSRAN